MTRTRTTGGVVDLVNARNWYGRELAHWRAHHRGLLVEALVASFGPDVAERLAVIDDTCRRLALPEANAIVVDSALEAAVAFAQERRRLSTLLREGGDRFERLRQELVAFRGWWTNSPGYTFEPDRNTDDDVVDAIDTLLARIESSARMELASEQHPLTRHIRRGRGRPQKPEIDFAHHELQEAGISRREDRVELLTKVGVIEPHSGNNSE